ncbi:MAG: hypothetical protein ACI4WS_04795 [Oscillospiraceae bacterium]
MIQRIYAREQLAGLPPGVETGKLLALFDAYGGGYDFCRFFRQSGGAGEAFLAALDGSFVLAGADRADFPELAQFLGIHGFTDLFCSLEAGEGLRRYLNADFHLAKLMEYVGEKGGEFPPEVSPSQAWDIIGSRFEIQFEPWYLDMSHRVRHGVSRCFSDGRAALVLQHDINGEALLSQVSVKREFEGRGCAGDLLKAVCRAVPGRVHVICDDKLAGFYQKCSFVPAGEKYAVLRI